MKRDTLIILIIVVLAILLIIVAVAHYFKYVCYPRDKTGMVNIPQVEDPFQGIAISLDENPSTGFLWTYTISPSTILSLVEDRYVSDPYDGDEPIDGLGGTHHWRFEVVESGTVRITFRLQRGDELLETVTYKYRCNSEDGSFQAF